MPVLAQTLLGVLIGVLVLHCRYDGLWYPHFGSETSILKSRVSSLQRSEAAAFYKSMLNPPARFYYFLATAAALVLLGQVGQAIQFPSKRVPNLFLALLTLVAGGIHVFKYLPLLKTFVPRYVRPDDEATALYLIAFWNAMTLGLLILSTLVSIGMEEAAEEQASRPKKKRSVHAESKTE